MESITQNKSIPWLEKYRPSSFNDIVLGESNHLLFRNILDKNYFPNLLFYGPPGTGKTTTIINLINEHQTIYNRKNKSTVIHLNASDERGIDIIRNQINQFVKSKNLFESGMKFVILDEVDYMTKNAQQALKYLLQSSIQNVRFCLVCNYITKIDESLKNEFICVRFNQLPKEDIFKFIRKISDIENIDLDDDIITSIQGIYGSDIRSMINFIQLNHNLKKEQWNATIMNSGIFIKIHGMFSTSCELLSTETIISQIHNISVQYNTDKKTILYKYFDYVIRNFDKLVVPEFLNILQIVIHNSGETDVIDTIRYLSVSLRELYNKFDTNRCYINLQSPDGFP